MATRKTSTANIPDTTAEQTPAKEGQAVQGEKQEAIVTGGGMEQAAQAAPYDGGSRYDYFDKLYYLDVNDRVEKKNAGGVELSYLSWAWAWAELLKHYPDATYHVHRFGENQLPYLYDEKTGYMVFTDVTVQGITRTMWLPVMDGANKAMKAESYVYKTRFGEKTCQAADMFDINKTIMRCLVKCISMFGLGLYIYAGEDLPSDPDESAVQTAINNAAKKAQTLSGEAAELNDLKQKIAEKLNPLVADKTPEQKMEIARNTIEPIVGCINFNVCNDKAKLKKLLDKLNKG